MLTDAAGQVHRPAAADPRIVSLVPSITELLIDLGLADRVVGRTGFCIHPREVVRRINEVRRIAIIGAAIVLEPDAPDDDVTLREMQDSVRELLGGLSRPRTLVLLDRLDTERTGPLLDEVLATAASGTATAVRMPWSAVADALARREA